MIDRCRSLLSVNATSRTIVIHSTISRTDADPSAKALLNALLDVWWSNTKPCKEAKPSRFSYRNRRAVRRWVFPVARRPLTPFSTRSPRHCIRLSTRLHAFTHGTSCPSAVRRTSPKCRAARATGVAWLRGIHRNDLVNSARAKSKTGVSVSVPETHHPAFRMAKEMKARLNGTHGAHCAPLSTTYPTKKASTRRM